MTPTLVGRWQTRVFLLMVVGLPVSIPFLAFGPLPLVVLGYALLIGLGLDVWYDRQQQERWDHDWPVHKQFKAGLTEFSLLLFTLLGCVGCSGLLLAAAPMLVIVVPIHWWSVWWLSFWMTQGPMRVLFPRWRFRGGRVW